MKALKGKKSRTSFLALVLILELGVSQAWAWGSATHTYIGDQLNRQGPGQIAKTITVVNEQLHQHGIVCEVDR